MILFYSEFCPHCNVLLDTIKRFDKSNYIKLVSVDTLRNLKKPIDKIHSVPALYLLDSKKYLFGKEVFDYLILKNKFTFSGENTRDNKKMKDMPNNSQLNGQSQTYDQPQAFTLGAISAEQFSSIGENGSIITDRNYKWDVITNDDTIMPADIPLVIKDSNGNVEKDSSDSSKKLPSIEEIMKRRATDIV